jgi:hypothetical protein
MTMKKTVLTLLALLATSSLHAIAGSGLEALPLAAGRALPGCSVGTVPFINASGVVECDADYSGFTLEDSTITMTSAGGSTAIETYGRRQAYVYNGSNPNELNAGLWIDYFYNQSGSVGTAHGIGLFVRNHGALSNTVFQAAIEGNTLCTSTQPFAYCGALIAHTKGDTQANGSPFPIGSLFFGVDSRIDITSDGFGSVASNSGTVMHFRPDPGSLGGADGMKFGWYSTDMTLQMVQGGNFFKLNTSSAAVGGGTLNLAGSCGGTIVLTSTAAVTMNVTTLFNAPSSSLTNGTFNEGCEVGIMNMNLVGGRTITFNDTTDFFPIVAAPVAVGPLGGYMKIKSVPSAGVWNQIQAITK